MWCSDLFNDLISVCLGCQSPFDMRCCSPQVLPCSHTLCLACVTSKVRKSGKRRCLICDKRYTSFHLNTALGETIERIRVRREALESQSRRCDECEKRAYLSLMRRCITCEIQLKEAQLTSVICLECCVDRHNGHALRVVTADAYVHKDEKVGLSISVCGSTTSSNQYRSNLSAHSSMNSPRLQSNTRLHSTSSGSSGFSSGGVDSSLGGHNPVDTRIGISQKMSSFFSRVTRSGSLPPHQSLVLPGLPMPSPFEQYNEQTRSLSSHQPSPPTVTVPMVPSPSRLHGRGTISSFRPAMGTLSPYMTPSRGGMSSLKKSLDDLDDCLPKGEILREETSPFYEGQSMYGMSLLVGGSSSPSPSPPPLSLAPSIDQSRRNSTEMKLEPKRASLPLTEGDYHRLSPFPQRRSPIMPPYTMTSIVSGGGGVKVQSPLASLANMPRRDPRIRGGPSYLLDTKGGPQYENENRLSLHSSGSSYGGERGDRRSTVERREETRERMKTIPSAATFFDKHIETDKQLAVAVVETIPSKDSAPPQYINVTRSCENLPSQFSKLDVNNNDGMEGVRRGRVREGRFPLRSSRLNHLSDHCCSYEYIGS
ncbi:hypothetical protein PENTCL1PPCAC_11333 [Pristionchus entomophagus]|uniref:RING-type domain-containing protein n=1 Tax=Pristionchus entomophagus TaxID=358040 RepID=A0AAV5T8K8_9BILA|nr:hypothetical protein PENTCL1PPCAC_11333 [Pristionchus entomophagus]